MLCKIKFFKGDLKKKNCQLYLQSCIFKPAFYISTSSKRFLFRNAETDRGLSDRQQQSNGADVKSFESHIDF